MERMIGHVIDRFPGDVDWFVASLLDRRAIPSNSPSQDRQQTGFCHQDPDHYGSHGPNNDCWPIKSPMDKLSLVLDDRGCPDHNGESPPTQPTPAPVILGNPRNR